MSEHRRSGAGDNDLLRKLTEALVNCDEEEVNKYAAEISKTDLDPLEVIENNLGPAMKTVGDKFERGEIFLTDLMIAGEAMGSATRLLTAHMSENDRKEFGERQRKAGRVVIGSVKGDIHDIGKNIVATLLTANRFEVCDAGKDLSPMEFTKKAEEHAASLIALSALMTTTMPAQADVINYLKEIGVRDRYKLAIGGGVTNKEWADEIEADGWAPDASGAVALAKRLLQVE